MDQSREEAREGKLVNSGLVEQGCGAWSKGTTRPVEWQNLCRAVVQLHKNFPL